jgi:hypothetical protein
VEVALLDTSVLQRDLAIERGRQTENDAALHLRANRVRVDRETAIDDADHACGGYRAMLPCGDLHDLRDEAAESRAECDSATCVPTHTSQPSGCTCTVQFIGSRAA